jgi:FkbM family methyltransferase
MPRLSSAIIRVRVSAPTLERHGGSRLFALPEPAGLVSPQTLTRSKEPIVQFRKLRQDVARRGVRLGLLAQAAGQHFGPPPDLTGTVGFDLPFGTILLDSHDEVIRPAIEAYGSWDPGGTAFFGKNARPGMTVLDVGAHVGYHTCHAGALVGPTGLVLAFEPEPRNFELLLANVWRNGLANVICCPWAVTDSNGFGKLHLSATNTGDHRLGDDEGGHEVVTVRTVSLDKSLVVRPPVDLVKIDVQGVERASVAGMANLLAASPTVRLTLEFWPHGILRQGGDPLETLAYYRSLGFRVVARKEDMDNPETPVTAPLTDEEIITYCQGQNGFLHVDLELERPPSQTRARGDFKPASA